jgi:D-serine deaminase-like pyridoxal phosphate-dependent protein
LNTKEQSENIRSPKRKNEIATPALVLDLDEFERNLLRMADAVRTAGKRLRPHAKAHKCSEIARRQIAAGAAGSCVATVNETEMLTRAGIGGLLLTTPLADARKMQRIAGTGAMVVIDHLQQVEWYEATKTKLNVLVDLDVGDHRTGAANIEQALEIARAVERSSYLTLRGIQAYSVRGSHGGDRPEREQICRSAFEIAAETRDAFLRAGLCADIVSGGSTGSWDVDLASPELTELQAGSYVLMDLAYRRLGLDFANALRVMVTVISANHADFVTVDGGYKAFSTDRGYGPEPLNLPGAGYRWGGDEFGFLDITECPTKPGLGDRIEFVPPHCDPTVNLHDSIHVCRGDEVVEIWPVMERSTLRSSR